MHIAENYWFNWFFGLWTFRHRFDVGTLLLVFELNMKNPAFAKQKNSSNAKGFLWRTNPWQAMHVFCGTVLFSGQSNLSQQFIRLKGNDAANGY